MMELNVLRMNLNWGYTIGHLECKGLSLWTLEDEVREIEGEPVEKWKIPKETAIPAGRYQVLVTYSQRFKKELPILLGVPGFTGVRIHSGNTQEDTEGCILVGKALSQDSSKIVSSHAAMIELMEVLDSAYEKGEEVWIKIQ